MQAGTNEIYLRHITGESQSNLRKISGTFQANIKLILGISQEYLRQISVKYSAYLRHILAIYHAYLCISQLHLRPLPGIYQAKDNKQIFVKYLVILIHISGKSQAYVSNILRISQTYLRYILEISQVMSQTYLRGFSVES